MQNWQQQQQQKSVNYLSQMHISHKKILYLSNKKHIVP